MAGLEIVPAGWGRDAAHGWSCGAARAAPGTGVLLHRRLQACALDTCTRAICTLVRSTEEGWEEAETWGQSGKNYEPIYFLVFPMKGQGKIMNPFIF